MANILLLYDLNEKDLARDFKDLLDQLNIESVIMIPLSTNRGFSLEEKEKHYFDSANGALFIITPGSERLGSLFPSPSVAHEMGQAKQKFQNKPECVIYLVDSECSLPAIDQKTYIKFNRKDIRIVIEAITQLISNLKLAGMIRMNPTPPQTTEPSKKFNIDDHSKRLTGLIKKVLFDISNYPSGIINDKDLTDLLTQNHKLNTQDINFLKRDLVRYDVAYNTVTDKPYYANFWFLTDVGWEIVRIEAEVKKKRDAEVMGRLGQTLLEFRIGKLKKE